MEAELVKVTWYLAGATFLLALTSIATLIVTFCLSRSQAKRTDEALQRTVEAIQGIADAVDARLF